MSTQQPEALRLADALEGHGYLPRMAAAAELRRLNSVNADLLEALQYLMTNKTIHYTYRNKAEEAIAKATGESK
jgi:hypothetical protein